LAAEPVVPDAAPPPGLIRAALVMLGTFAATAAVGLLSAWALTSAGREDLLHDFARAFEGLLAWRLVPGQPALTGCLILLGNGLACAFVALGGPAACALELRARAQRGLLDRFLRVAYSRPGVAGRLFPPLGVAGPEAPRTGIAVSVMLPALCLAVNGLYTGLALGAVLGTPLAERLPQLVSYAPLECLALALSGALSVCFAGTCAVREVTAAGGLGQALRAAHTRGRVALVAALLAAAAFVESVVLEPMV
jgi:hypothetical protein